MVDSHLVRVRAVLHRQCIVLVIVQGAMHMLYIADKRGTVSTSSYIFSLTPFGHSGSKINVHMHAGSHMATSLRYVVYWML